MLENLDLFGVSNKNTVFAIGVVEDNSDPLTLGRVKARYFNFHPSDRNLVPTKDLPWSQVLTPATSASNSGVGWSPNGLERGSWVFAIFLDGEEAQFPMVLGSIPGIHRASGPNSSIGNSGAGYLTDDDPYSGNETPGPWHPLYGPAPGKNSVIKDDGSYLTKQNAKSWPLEFYGPEKAPSGLACKDANGSLRIHLASALALENLTRDVGKGKLYITSAYRTPAYNSRLSGAAKNSMHVQGRAFDIALSSVGDVKRFAQLAVKNGFTGFGLYSSFIHIDTGKGRVWRGAKSASFVKALKEAGWYPGKPGLSDVKVTPGNANTSTDSAVTNNQINEDPSGVAEPKTKKEVASYIEKRMAEEGYSKAATAAVLAHAQNESGFDPSAFNPNDVGKPSGGLFQWRGDRLDGLKNYAQQRNLDPNNASTQLDYFFYELGHNESAAGNALRTANSAEEANRAMSSFERFAGWNTGGNEFYERLAGTKQYLNEGVAGVANEGFADPTGSFPYGGYRGKPSTHHSARGMNGNLFQPENVIAQSGRAGAFPVAADEGTIGEPDIGEAPQYPYNKTYTTKSGHIMEWDDTPESERVNLQHKSGSRIVFGAKGTVVHKTEGKAYKVDNNDSYHMVNGDYVVSVKDDIKMRSTSDIVIHVDGSRIDIIKNDISESVSGKKDINVGETFQLKASKIIIEADQIDFVSHGSINMEAGSDVNIKAGGNVNLHGTEAHIRGDTVYMDDVIRAAEDGANELGENSASSTDLGTVPSRAQIEKQYEPKTDSDSVTTGDDAADYYGVEV